jgi:hypothetical protein
VRPGWPLRALLVGWAVWVGLHAPLSHLLGFSAWKLGGMGMFADHGDWLDGSVYVAVIDADPELDLSSIEHTLRARLRDEHRREGWSMDYAFLEHLSLSGGDCLVRELPAGEALDEAHEGVLLWPNERSVQRLIEVVQREQPRQWLVARVISGWQDGQTFELCLWPARRCSAFRHQQTRTSTARVPRSDVASRKLTR